MDPQLHYYYHTSTQGDFMKGSYQVSMNLLRKSRKRELQGENSSLEILEEGQHLLSMELPQLGPSITIFL